MSEDTPQAPISRVSELLKLADNAGFNDLSDAERKLLESVAIGEYAICGPGNIFEYPEIDPSKWDDPDNDLSKWDPDPSKGDEWPGSREIHAKPNSMALHRRGGPQTDPSEGDPDLRRKGG